MSAIFKEVERERANFEAETPKMKLSKAQLEVLQKLSEGWELGSSLTQIGFTVEIERGVLQKNGLGCGQPLKDVKIITINALVKKGLIKRLPNPYVRIEFTKYELTEKGKTYINYLKSKEGGNIE